MVFYPENGGRENNPNVYTLWGIFMNPPNKKGGPHGYDSYTHGVELYTPQSWKLNPLRMRMGVLYHTLCSRTMAPFYSLVVHRAESGWAWPLSSAVDGRSRNWQMNSKAYKTPLINVLACKLRNTYNSKTKSFRTDNFNWNRGPWAPWNPGARTFTHQAPA